MIVFKPDSEEAETTSFDRRFSDAWLHFILFMNTFILKNQTKTVIKSIKSSDVKHVLISIKQMVHQHCDFNTISMW